MLEVLEDLYEKLSATESRPNVTEWQVSQQCKNLHRVKT